MAQFITNMLKFIKGARPQMLIKIEKKNLLEKCFENERSK